MKHHAKVLSLVFLLAGAVGFAGVTLTTSACASAPVNLSPQAQTAFTNHRVQRALDLIRDTVDDGAQTTPPAFSHALDVKVATWHESALKIIHASGTGWKAAVLQGLDELANDVTPEERQRIALYVTLAKTVINEVAP